MSYFVYSFITILFNTKEGFRVYLVDIVTRFVVLLLVVDEAAAVGPGPGALVALVRMLPRVPPPVVDRVVRTHE